MSNQTQQYNVDLSAFLDASPTPFHAVSSMSRLLEALDLPGYMNLMSGISRLEIGILSPAMAHRLSPLWWVPNLSPTLACAWPVLIPIAPV